MIRSSDKAKAQLIKLAKDGCRKPKSSDSLYWKLTEYINEGRSSYDPVFTKEIKKLAPSWFENTADLKKQELLKMAKNGSKRPNQRKHPLGYTLDSYTKESSNSFDAEFVAKLMELAPNWFRADKRQLMTAKA
jgi:hypothetical protein